MLHEWKMETPPAEIFYNVTAKTYGIEVFFTNYESLSYKETSLVPHFSIVKVYNSINFLQLTMSTLNVLTTSIFSIGNGKKYEEKPM